MTEVGGASAIQTHNCKEIESVGYILPNFQLKVVDLESGKTLGPNQPGECYMRGPMQMVDYYENPEATESAVDEEGTLLKARRFLKVHRLFRFQGGFIQETKFTTPKRARWS